MNLDIFSSKPKIRYLSLILLGQKDIFRFNVPVCYFYNVVDVIDCKTDLLHVPFALALKKFSVLYIAACSNEVVGIYSFVLVDETSRTILKYQIHLVLLFILNHFIKLDNERVIHLFQNGYLVSNIIFSQRYAVLSKKFLLELFFSQNFHCILLFGMNINTQIHS